MIDPCSPCNLVSREFGEHLLPSALESANPYPCVETLNTVANGIMKIEARWNCVSDLSIRNQRLKLDLTMVRSESDISEHGNRFDVIIGRPDIVK